MLYMTILLLSDLLLVAAPVVVWSQVSEFTGLITLNNTVTGVSSNLGCAMTFFVHEVINRSSP